MVNDTPWREWLKPVMDPELGLSLVDLGLIYDVKVENSGFATATITLTSPACPAGDEIIQKITEKLREQKGITEVKVNVVWEPKWDPAKMASDECKEILGIW